MFRLNLDELIQRLNEMRIDRKNQFFMKDYVEFSEDVQQVQYRTSNSIADLSSLLRM